MNVPGRRFAGYLGYLHDLFRLASCTMSNPHSYLKFLMINRARKATGGAVFVETGTYLGGTAYRCSKVFQWVYTIELDPALAARARKNLASRRNVEVIEGDAVRELGSLFARGDVTNAVVFLDGHYSGGDTARGTTAEPAVEAVEVIARYRERVSAVIIDDFRNFGVEPGHPPKSQLILAIERGFPFPEFSIQIQNDQVVVTRRAP